MSAPITYSIALETALRKRGLAVQVGSRWIISAGNCRKVKYQLGTSGVTVEQDGRERTVIVGVQTAEFIAGVIDELLRRADAKTEIVAP
jgi:hypothetical protein